MSSWDSPPREREGGRVVLVMLLGMALLFGGGYAAAYVLAGDRVPRGTTVDGVEIGGVRPPAAVRQLRAGLADRADRTITVTVNGAAHPVAPQEAGLAVDYDATVRQAGTEQSWRPSRLWDYYTAAPEVDPVVTLDPAAMDAEIARIGAEVDIPARDGAVVFRRGDVHVRPARTGERIDPQEARDAIAAAYLQHDPSVELTLHPSAPDIDDADVQRALDDFANPALSAAVTLVLDGSRIRLQPRQFSRVLGLRAEGGRLVPDLDERGLTGMVDRRVSRHGGPVDATVALVHGRPKVIPAQPGVTYRPHDVTDAFLRLVTRPDGRRHMRVKATVAQPKFTTGDARRLRIRQRVSSFTTYYPYAEYRNTNIGRAAELVNGTVLKPGQTFSLNRTVGERTRRNGFTRGFVINDGVFKEDLGGGVSQMATTTFNAMFFAGLQDVEHKPHSFYIDRYPVGREATVAWGSVDLRFRNDTPYGVLISAHVTPSTPSSQGVVSVSMYSTKVWDITASTSDRYNPVPPKTRHLTGADCYPNSGYAGFDVDVTRHFRKAGQGALDHDEVFHTHYTPSDTVVCR